MKLKIKIFDYLNWFFYFIIIANFSYYISFIKCLDFCCSLYINVKIKQNYFFMTYFLIMLFILRRFLSSGFTLTFCWFQAHCYFLSTIISVIGNFNNLRFTWIDRNFKFFIDIIIANKTLLNIIIYSFYFFKITIYTLNWKLRFWIWLLSISRLFSVIFIVIKILFLRRLTLLILSFN